jgi:uncharacterized coiled-coil protein SlyX
MNRSISIAVRGLVFAVLSACLAISPAALAVTPAPDGGYPNGVTAEGSNALFSLTSGVWDTALGYQTLYNTTTGTSNTAAGVRALFNNINGNNNTAYGVYALYNITSGSHNIGIGELAGLNLTTESNVIVIGSRGEAGEENYIRIGTEGVHTETYIAGIFGVPVEGEGIPVCVNDEGQLGICTVSSQPNAMLLNEFLKEHQTVQELKATVATQQAIIAQQSQKLEAFASNLKEQQAQIQKVSAQLTASRPAPQVVDNR